MNQSMTNVACDHLKANTNLSNKLGNIFVLDDGGKKVLLKAGQTIIKKHYGRPYWKEAGIHVIKLSKDNYLLPTNPIR